MILTFRCVLAPRSQGFQIPYGALQINDDLPPRELHRLRIYERMQPLNVLAKLDSADREVITDALLERKNEQQRAHANKLLDDSELLGAWHPSTIRVDRFVWNGGNRWLISHPVLAHALWDLEIGDLGEEMIGPVTAPQRRQVRRFLTVGRHDGFDLQLSNDEPFEREIFIHVLFRPRGSTNGFGDDSIRRLIEVGTNVERSADEIRKRLELDKGIFQFAPEARQASNEAAIRELSNLVAALASAIGRTVRK